MLALPPSEGSEQVQKVQRPFNPERLAQLSKPRPKKDDPIFKSPRAEPKKDKKISRKQIVEQAQRVKQRQERAMQKKKKAAKENPSVLAITDGTTSGTNLVLNESMNNLNSRRKNIQASREQKRRNETDQKAIFERLA